VPQNVSVVHFQLIDDDMKGVDCKLLARHSFRNICGILRRRHAYAVVVADFRVLCAAAVAILCTLPIIRPVTSLGP